MRTSKKTYRNECQEGHVEPAKTLRAVNSIDLGKSYMKYLSGFVSKQKKKKKKKIITPQERSQDFFAFLCTCLSNKHS